MARRMRPYWAAAWFASKRNTTSGGTNLDRSIAGRPATWCWILATDRRLVGKARLADRPFFDPAGRKRRARRREFARPTSGDWGHAPAVDSLDRARAVRARNANLVDKWRKARS